MTIKATKNGKAVSRTAKAKEGYVAALKLIRHAERTAEDDAALNPKFRQGPQVNFVLPHLLKLAKADAKTIEGYAAVLSDYLTTAVHVCAKASHYRRSKALGLS